MTTFKSALSVCGLTQTQAQEFFGVKSIQTIKHWSSGRNNPPPRVWGMLADLYERIQDAADFAAGHMALDGIAPRSYGRIEADCGTDTLPDGAASVAGAAALLMAICALEP